MEIDQKPKQKRLLGTLGVPVICILITGGLVYLVMNQQVIREKEKENKIIQEMQRQVDNLRKTDDACIGQTQNTTNNATIADETADWQTYADTNYNFSFKYPKGLVAYPSASNNMVNYYSILINRSKDISTDGVIIGDVSGAYLQIGDSSTISGSPAIINSPSGKIDAVYSGDVTSDASYDFYVYEFQKNGKYYAFAMHYNSNTPSMMTSEEFKQMVDTITFN